MTALRREHIAAVPASTSWIWRAALAQFDRWLQLEMPRRQAWLAELQRTDPAVHERVAAMIDADEQAEARGFLDPDAVLLRLTNDDAPTAEFERAGQQLGAWRLEEPIGVGGMGQVWRATRNDGLYASEAAVKLLHRYAGDPQAQARFAREGELLARLSHPHVARLFDAGVSDDGHRYLVLEYVKGRRIDHWCDERRLGVAARVALFLQVCDAVAYAHAHLVVHRDLKPANLLVNDDGCVKLLDFGVAKLLDEPGREAASDLTQGAPAGLTPEYAAPEQLDAQPITTATDVYALGVVLFELLCGTRPYAMAMHGVASVVRAVVDDPPLRLTDGVARAPDAATARGVAEAALRRSLEGDLEAIVAKALKKLPGERYQSVSALRDDLQRHLLHEPVRAQTDRFIYRARKFAQRNRAQVGALTAVMATLVAGIGVTSWQWRAAQREAERTKAAVQVLTETFAGLGPEESGTANVPVAELLKRGWAQAQRHRERDPELAGMLAQPFALMFVAADDLRDAGDALTLARAHLSQAGRERSAEYVKLTVELGYVRFRERQLPVARQLLEEAIATDAGLDDLRLVAPVQALSVLAEIEQLEGRRDAASRRFEQAIALSERRFGARHRTYVQAASGLALLRRSEGRWDEARRWMDLAAPGVPGLAGVFALNLRRDVAILDIETGRYAEAARALPEIVSAYIATWGTANALTVYAQTWLSQALFHAGDADAAHAAMEQALQWSAAVPEAHVRRHVQIPVARQLMRSGQLERARVLIDDTFTHFDTQEPSAQPYLERARALRGEWELRSGLVQQAVATLRDAAEQQRALAGARPFDAMETQLLLALAIDASAGATAAEPEYARAQAQADAASPVGHRTWHRARLLHQHALQRHAPSEAGGRRLTELALAFRTATQDRWNPAGSSVAGASSLVLDDVLATFAY